VESWVEMDENKCRCRGTGWAEVSQDRYTECPIHYEGQLHPDTQALLLDEPNRLAEEERKSRLQYHIKEARIKILDFQKQLKAEQEKLVKLELELINRTPTVKAMPAIQYGPVVEQAEEHELTEDEITYLEGDSI
jgi:hypothetical protein